MKLTDIAHSLGLMVRFNGHTKRLYTVAEHCVLVALILRDYGCDAETQMVGLLHDAAEAYIGDVPTPVKWAMDAVPDSFGFGQAGTAAFREIERRIEKAIADKFFVSYEAMHSKMVKLADNHALSTEARDLLPGGIQWPVELAKPHEFAVDAAMFYMQTIHHRESWNNDKLLTPAELYVAVYMSLANERIEAMRRRKEQPWLVE